MVDTLDIRVGDVVRLVVPPPPEYYDGMFRRLLASNKVRGRVEDQGLGVIKEIPMLRVMFVLPNGEQTLGSWLYADRFEREAGPW